MSELVRFIFLLMFHSCNIILADGHLLTTTISKHPSASPSYNAAPTPKPFLSISKLSTSIAPSNSCRPTASHSADLTGSAQQETDANALCAFKLGIVNWPSNPTPHPSSSPSSLSSPTSTKDSAPTIYPTISPNLFIGWDCNGTIATSFPCGLGNVNWTGITCGTGGGGQSDAVVKLSLNNNFLAGTISSFLSAITSLTYLSLFGNLLSGEIPSQLSTLTSLTYLDLNANSLTGSFPSELCALKSLAYLDLKINLLSGTIKSELSALSSLAYLDLDTNSLTGSIPSELSSLTSLFYLDLDKNLLTKSIPSQLSALTSLTLLDFDTNFLTGTIPRELSVLSLLDKFALYDNRLTGSIFSEIGNIVSLQYLLLNNNYLRGSLPPSFSALSNLTFLYLQNNTLSSSISSDMFSNFNHLQVLDLSYNELCGQLPSSLSMLKSTLVYFAASKNKFEGDPFFFLGFPYISLVNLSYNSFDDTSALQTSSSSSSSSHLSSSLDFNCPKLNYLDISNNYLTGLLPDSIGTVFCNLTLLSASNNCFLSYVPESLCNLKNLTTLLLSGLGNLTSFTSIDIIQQRTSFTIPSCLFSLPLLETAHLVSNQLYGTLGEISPNMASLSLVGNLLTGTIPKSIQTSSSKLNFLQLSINRLSGTLVDNAFNDMTDNSKIDLFSNRISGDIPASFNKFVEVGDFKPDILSGNVFNCKDKAPSTLVDFETYSCGSSSIDFYKYVYSVICVTVVLLAVYIILEILKRRAERKKNNGNHSSSDSSSDSNINSNSSVRKNKNKNKNTISLFIIYFQHRPFPTASFKSLVSSQFLGACLLVALSMTILNMGYSVFGDSSTLSFKNSFSTIFVRYGWASAFIYVHGVLPFLLILIGLSTLLFVYLYWFEADDSITNKEINNEENSNLTNNTGSSTGNDIVVTAAITTDDSPSRRFTFTWVAKVLSSSYRNICASAVFSFADNSSKRWMLVLQMINVITVTGVNVLYIFGENSKNVSITYKKIIPIVLSIFKIMWANTFVVFMAKFGIRSKVSIRFIFLHYVFALVYIYVLVPIITVYVTDHDCFYFPMFSQIPSITEIYPSVNPNIPRCVCANIACTKYNCPIAFESTTISQSITPTWIYGYQCGVRILTNYVPAVLSSYTIKGVLLPILKLFLLSFPPDSRIRNLLFVKLLLLRFTVNKMSEVDLGKQADREFRTFIYLSNHVTDLLMLFTYGILCPFLTFLFVWSIVVNEIVDHIQVGSYVYDTARMIDQELEDDKINNTKYEMKTITATVENPSNSLSNYQGNQVKISNIISNEARNLDIESDNPRNEPSSSSSTCSLPSSHASSTSDVYRNTAYLINSSKPEERIGEGIVRVNQDNSNGWGSVNSKIADPSRTNTSTSDTPNLSDSSEINDSFLDSIMGSEMLSSQMLPSQVAPSRKVDRIQFQYSLISRIYLSNSSKLVMLVWKPIIVVILFFVTLILFDMIADVYTIASGTIVVVSFWLFIYFLFGSGKTGFLSTLTSILACFRGIKTLLHLDKVTLEVGNNNENSNDDDGVVDDDDKKNNTRSSVRSVEITTSSSVNPMQQEHGRS